MKPADVERQKILEGYGYKFLRLNRFNVGDNPVLTLDERIRTLISDIDTERQPPSLIEKYQQRQADLETGESKACTKCSSVKSIDEFFDQSLKSGAGGYGRICMTCKGGKKPKRGRSKRRAKVNVQARDEGNRTYLVCPYAEKDECKKLGGRWDAFAKKWYVPDGLDLEAFEKWLK
jgi:hypothetical protein